MSRTNARRPPVRWLFGDTFRREAVCLRSPLSADGARAALQDVGVGRSLLAVDAVDAPLRGSLRSDRVRAFRRSGLSNSWAPQFRGRLDTTGDGVILDGELAVGGFVRWYSVLWMLAAVVGALAATVSAITTGDAIALVVWGFPLFFIGLIHLGARLARSDWEMIRAALREALQATEVTGDAPV